MNDNIPFRPIAMMLKIMPAGKIKNKPIKDEDINKIKEFLKNEIELFDTDCAPAIELRDNLELPIRAAKHILIKPSNNSLESYFELGFVTQQILTYLSYLYIKYNPIFQNGEMVIPISHEGSTTKDKTVDGYLQKNNIEHKDLIYFEEWGSLPEGFFEDNHKLFSVMHYSKVAPSITGSGNLKMIMDETNLYLFCQIENTTKLHPNEMISAGILVYNFYKTAEMLGLKGEWKLLREIDISDSKKFAVPDNAKYIAAWHGQLY